jgi:hypothetical protein
LEVLAEPRLAQVLRESRWPGWWVLRVLLEQPQELGELRELRVLRWPGLRLLAQERREFPRPGWWVLRVLLEQPQELGELQVFP